MLHDEGASRVERLSKALTTVRKESDVKDLVKAMLEDVYLLVSNRNINTVTTSELDKVGEAFRSTTIEMVRNQKDKSKSIRTCDPVWYYN